MNSVANIEKIAEVKEIQLLVEASERDNFRGTLAQAGVLPFIFYYGNRRTITHTCLNCGLVVEAEFGYGSKQLIGLGSLSRQDFNENRAQLDVVGKLFDQYLYHNTDENGFESYLYKSGSKSSGEALLSAAYYCCSHCQAQYLMLYQMQPKEHIPPFEPDEILIEKIYQVAFDHDGLMRALGLTQAMTAA